MIIRLIVSPLYITIDLWVDLAKLLGWFILQESHYNCPIMQYHWVVGWSSWIWELVHFGRVTFLQFLPIHTRVTLQVIHGWKFQKSPILKIHISNTETFFSPVLYIGRRIFPILNSVLILNTFTQILSCNIKPLTCELIRKSMWVNTLYKSHISIILCNK